jgi:quercetin dioxygenase-like cupin family protein
MRWGTTLFTLVAWSVAFATPAAGIVSAVTLAQGATPSPLKERAAVGDGWAVNLEGKGESEFYFRDAVYGPDGHSGWHTHPGILLITVKEGSVEFYDKACTKHVYVAGQSFTEGAEPHAVVNRGKVNAHLLSAFIVKKGEPLRIEAPQPKCGATLGIP